MATSSKTSQKFPFFSMSRELRNEIYNNVHRTVQPTGGPRSMRHFTISISPVTCAELLRVNQQMKQEYEEEVYRKALLGIDTFCHWTLGPDGGLSKIIPQGILSRLKNMKWRMRLDEEDVVERADSFREPYQDEKAMSLLRELPALKDFELDFEINGWDFDEWVEKGQTNAQSIFRSFEAFAQKCRDEMGLRVTSRLLLYCDQFSLMDEEKDYVKSHFGQTYIVYEASLSNDPNNSYAGLDLEVFEVGACDWELYKSQLDQEDSD